MVHGDDEAGLIPAVVTLLGSSRWMGGDVGELHQREGSVCLRVGTNYTRGTSSMTCGLEQGGSTATTDYPGVEADLGASMREGTMATPWNSPPLPPMRPFCLLRGWHGT